MDKSNTSQFIRFVAVNILAAMANIATKLVSGFVLNDLLAVFAGFCAGLSTSYLLCRRFVFQINKGPRISELAKFTSVNLAGLGITYFTYRQILLILQHSARWDPSLPTTQTLAHTIGVGAPVILSFIAQKTITFRQRLN